jgi:glycosyltransferase involved in cell wall biosynthesis
MSMGIVMPSRNVEGMVKPVLDQIRKEQWEAIGKIVIVDNGSVDLTLNEIKQSSAFLEHPNKFHFILNGMDKGYGYSLKTGFDFLSSLLEVKYFVVMHSDDQFNSDELLDQYFKLVPDSFDSAAIIAREFGFKYESSLDQLVRNLGNLFISLFSRACIAKTVKDINSPFCMFSKELYLDKIKSFHLLDDILFHPRLNIILATSSHLSEGSCSWRRASKTNRAPKFRMGFHIVVFFARFGISYRLRGKDAHESYHSALTLFK